MPYLLRPNYYLTLHIYAESFLITKRVFSGVSKTSAYYVINRAS